MSDELDVEISLDATEMTSSALKSRLEAIREFAYGEETASMLESLRADPDTELVAVKEGHEVVALPLERWDHVIHAMEDVIGQLEGPTGETPPESIQAEIDQVQDTLELIYGQVSSNGDER